jgi:hypothetical protein
MLRLKCSNCINYRISYLYVHMYLLIASYIYVFSRHSHNLLHPDV